MRRALLLTMSGGVALLVGAATLVGLLGGGSDEDRVRTQVEMSTAEQREVLQMFFPSALPRDVAAVKIESYLPAMGDGEVHASFRVRPREAMRLVKKLKATGTANRYTSPAFTHANGAIFVSTESGQIVIDWSEY